jgi:hypothetical protein
VGRAGDSDGAVGIAGEGIVGGLAVEIDLIVVAAFAVDGVVALAAR